MRIVCPSCAAAYEVPDARIVPGQSVRCARCGGNWVPVADVQPQATPPMAPQLPSNPSPSPGPMPVPVPPSAPAFPAPGPHAPAFDRPLASAAAEPAVLAGWILSFAVLAGLAWAAIAWRDDIMQAWPPSERLYSVLGLPAGR